MGTFHNDKGELHGITVVVETSGPELFIGRCDEIDDQNVILHDADVHREDEGGQSRKEYLERAAQLGVWKKFDRLAISRDKVTRIFPLGEL